MMAGLCWTWERSVLLGLLARRESTKGRGRQGVEVPLLGMAQVRGVREEQ